MLGYTGTCQRRGQLSDSEKRGLDVVLSEWTVWPYP